MDRDDLKKLSGTGKRDVLTEINSKEAGCRHIQPFLVKKVSMKRYGLLNLDFPLAAGYKLMLRFFENIGLLLITLPKFS